MNEIDTMQPVAGFAACRTVTYSHSLHLIHLYHALDGSRSLALPVAGRMRINNFMMNQIALRIKTASLATIGKTRVNRHHAFLSERSRQQELAQVFGEDHNSLLIRLLLAERSKFGFNARLQQSLKGIIHRFTHQRLALTETMYIVALQFILTLLIISRDADTQESCRLASTHSQQPVRRTLLQWFREIEIVGEALRLFLILLLGYHLRSDDGTASELTANLIAALLILTYGFGDDVLGTLECSLHILHLIAHKLPGSLFRIAFTLEEEQLCQRLQSSLTCYLCTCSALRLIRKIDVFQFGGIPALFDAFFQFIREFSLFLDGFEDSLFSLRHLREFLVSLCDGFNVYLVHITGFLLAVSRDKRNGAALFEQRQSIFYSLLLQIELGCYQLCKLIHL